MRAGSVLGNTLAALGLMMPGASRARSVSRSRFDGQSEEAKEQALAKAVAKRERRNEKRLRDFFATNAGNPIFVREITKSAGISPSADTL